MAEEARARVDQASADDARGLIPTLVGDGRPLLLAVAGGLLFAGGFAMFLAASREFLPQDIHYLGMSADELCGVAHCRVVDFMVHDRASFGGTLFAIGVLYVWLTVFPLSCGEQWAWWTLLISGSLGFLGFLSYLGFGYLDTWHGIGTLLMLPLFIRGLVRSRGLIEERVSLRSLLKPGPWILDHDRHSLGRLILIAGAIATAGGGLAILRIGVGDTFVPEDLAFIGRSVNDLRSVNPHLVPLLAHDRAGFGSGVLTVGITSGLCLWHGSMSRHLHQAIAAAGIVSTGAAISIHFIVGYTTLVHLAPAVVAASSLIIGLALQHPGSRRRADGADPIARVQRRHHVRRRDDAW